MVRENDQINQANNTIKVHYSDKDIDEQKSDEDTRKAVLKRRKSGSPIRNNWTNNIGSPRIGGFMRVQDHPFNSQTNKSNSFVDIPYQTQFRRLTARVCASQQISETPGKTRHMSPSNASLSSRDNLNPMKPLLPDQNPPSGKKPKKYADNKKPPTKSQTSIEKSSRSVLHKKQKLPNLLKNSSVNHGLSTIKNNHNQKKNKKSGIASQH